MSSSPSRAAAAKILLTGLGVIGVLVLPACVAPGSLPQPKYPIYMQDKPAETSDTPAPSDEGATPPGDASPAIIAPESHGDIATNDLPPPPPPPADDVTAATAASTSSSSSAASAAAVAPVTAPVRDTHAASVYVLQAHDTLYGVSRRFGVPVKTLYDINALGPDSSLRVGQRILLPASAADKGAEAHANGPGMARLGGAPDAEGPPPTAVAPPARPVTVAAAKPPAAKPAVAAKPVVTPPATTTTVTTTKPSGTTTTTTTVVAAPPPGGFPSGAQLSAMGKGLFVWPVKGRIVVPFGQLAPNVRNDGINIAAEEGSNVLASADGVVVYEGDQVKELGNTIYVKHPGGWYTGYSHLGTMAVTNNERVTKGEIIGTVGHTGVIDRPQLHFEIRYTPSTDIAKPVDPNLVLP